MGRPGKVKVTSINAGKLKNVRKTKSTCGVTKFSPKT